MGAFTFCKKMLKKESSVFNEPSGMMNVDLNCGEHNIPDLKKKYMPNPVKTNTINVIKILGICLSVLALGIFSYIISCLIKNEYNLFLNMPYTSSNLTNNYTSTKILHTKEALTNESKGNFFNLMDNKNNKWIDQNLKLSKNNNIKNANLTKVNQKRRIFKKKIKSYLADLKEKFDLCKITQSLKDCCDIFLQTNLYTIRELCTVDDVLDVLINYEKKLNLRKRRQTHNFMQMSDDIYDQDHVNPQDMSYPKDYDLQLVQNAKINLKSIDNNNNNVHETKYYPPNSVIWNNKKENDPASHYNSVIKRKKKNKDIMPNDSNFNDSKDKRNTEKLEKEKDITNNSPNSSQLGRLNFDASELKARGNLKTDALSITSEDLQSNQQTIINPCFYPTAQLYNQFKSPFDNSQVLKIIPVNQPKPPSIQSPFVVMNPPLYSFVSPQYTQFPVTNNPYAVQASGPNGQYYICQPISASSNNAPNIAAMPGIEVRENETPNLQDLLEHVESEPDRRNISREAVDCPIGEQSCQDGSKCIMLHQICDNEVNCDDSSDEMFCSCKERVGSFRLCDGFPDCPNGIDEIECFGCKENEFSCDDWSRFRPSTCIPILQRCDNIRQCEVTGKDEEDCSVLVDKVGISTQYKISNSVGFLHRNFKGKWYPTCFGTNSWAMEVCNIEAGPSNIVPRSHMVSSTVNYEGEFLNLMPNNNIYLVNFCALNKAAFIECPPIFCGLRMLVKNPYRPEEVDTESEDMLEKFERENMLELKMQNLTYKNNLKNNKFNKIRVVGGKPSQPGAWPWLVSIFKNGVFHCGGVIINEIYIVTAAHCVDRYWQYYYEIQAGMLRRFSYSPMEQSRWAVAAVSHENYNKNTLADDIALMKLSSPLRYNRYIRPICLPSEMTAGKEYLQGPPPGTICTTVGWGATIEHGTDPDHMREVEVPVLPGCKHEEDQIDSVICAGLSEGGKDACQGDSGGPFMCRNPNNLNQWYLAGIVSHGEGCARPNEPGVYTKVSRYLEWIAENMREDIFYNRIPLHKCPGFICKKINKCLPKKRRCDKIIDCFLGDDEQDCENKFSRILGSSNNKFGNTNSKTSNTTITKVKKNKSPVLIKNSTTITLSNNVFKCKRMLQIINIKKRCDKIRDCEDGTDEEHCLCVDYVKHFNTRAICDGITDCFDISDENNCKNCSNLEFYCQFSNKCISLKKNCDGIMDCEKNEDERDCEIITNGKVVLMDSDSRPELLNSGLVTINRFGIWKPLCVNSLSHPLVATNVCSSQGFDGYVVYQKYFTQEISLKVVYKDNKDQNLTNTRLNQNINICEGLFVVCSNISTDISIHNLFKQYGKSKPLYATPWNVLIYANGVYRCMGTILNAQWIITSLHCFEDVKRFSDYYVVAVLGMGKTNLPVAGPYENIIQATEMVRISNSDIILIRLKKEIKYTRYIKPTYLYARRDSVQKEKCIATGMENGNLEYVQLTSIKECLEGLRCFESKLKVCNSTVKWSGTIICDSRNGWYPASVFNVENGSCGFSKVKHLTSINYFKNKIQKAITDPEFISFIPQCDGFRCNLGECLELNKTCNGIYDCRGGEDENANLCYEKERQCNITNNCSCSTDEFKCSNSNKCVKKSAFCNKFKDCENGEDEPNICSCKAYLKLTHPEKICDGKIHCLDRSDEDPLECSCTPEKYQCSGTNKCVSYDVVCDGSNDCPNGADENFCFKMKNLPNSEIAGEIVSRTAGVWHKGCFEKKLNHNKVKEICKVLGFNSIKPIQIDIPEYEKNITALRPITDKFNIVWIYKNKKNKLKIKMRTGNRPFVKFQSKTNCYRLFVKCL